ncbi:hypothetical protein CBR_g21949 [Chara braunii]|uniref:AB hydrolase-1 domain-containing protein n=1 Tax=Chara braunii TaxID=69332 RepID=A0A388L1L4_CHABU|nr:hypothetical protein CBR_g21949 [Chara braunii]|eukprot:GBG76200.1 hypothetical protein CBR_g21949 [Chara braunii]
MHASPLRFCERHVHHLRPGEAAAVYEQLASFLFLSPPPACTSGRRCARPAASSTAYAYPPTFPRRYVGSRALKAKFPRIPVVLMPSLDLHADARQLRVSRRSCRSSRSSSSSSQSSLPSSHLPSPSSSSSSWPSSLSPVSSSVPLGWKKDGSCASPLPRTSISAVAAAQSEVIRHSAQVCSPSSSRGSQSTSTRASFRSFSFFSSCSSCYCCCCMSPLSSAEGEGEEAGAPLRRDCATTASNHISGPLLFPSSSSPSPLRSRDLFSSRGGNPFKALRLRRGERGRGALSRARTVWGSRTRVVSGMGCQMSVLGSGFLSQSIRSGGAVVAGLTSWGSRSAAVDAAAVTMNPLTVAAVVLAAILCARHVRNSWLLKCAPPELVIAPNELNLKIAERCPILTGRDSYRPVPFLTNCHVETIFAALFRLRPDVRFRRECLRAPCGGVVALDWPVGGDGGVLAAVRRRWRGGGGGGGGRGRSSYSSLMEENATWLRRDLPPDAPVLILLPGLTGGSGDSYVRHLLVSAAREGYRPMVFNSRGCADSPVTTPQFYSASFTDDLRLVVRHVNNLYPDANLYAVGWSLGANILIRYLGQEGSNTPLKGAVSLANPFDLVEADIDFGKGFNRVYSNRLANVLGKIFRKHEALFEGIGGEFDLVKARAARTVREFDEGLTRVSFGYRTVEDYYFDASSCRSVPYVRIPLLCVQAQDDPIAPARGIPRKALSANPNCILVVTPGGGHLGWCSGKDSLLGAPWSDPLVIEYLRAVEAINRENPPSTSFSSSASSCSSSPSPSVTSSLKSASSKTGMAASSRALVGVTWQAENAPSNALSLDEAERKKSGCDKSHEMYGNGFSAVANGGFAQPNPASSLPPPRDC